MSFTVALTLERWGYRLVLNHTERMNGEFIEKKKQSQTDISTLNTQDFQKLNRALYVGG